MTKFTNNPLKNCKLRTAGLASARGAMFGMTRTNPNGTPRAHQGIDLASDAGFRVYAVEDGTIVGTNLGRDGYGFTITLKMETNNNLNNLFTFYSHLSRIDVQIGTKVKAGQQIGITGDTGNAKGMNTVAKGGHLHFELRTKQTLGKGLAGRLDALPYITI